MRRSLLIAVALSGLVGCAETRFYSGRPPGVVPPGYDARWHSAYLFGTADAGGPYDLMRICPGGWAEIMIAPDFFTSVVSVATLFMYTPNRLTIVCAGPAGGDRGRATPDATAAPKAR